jgi:hypothetical protein
MGESMLATMGDSLCAAGTRGVKWDNGRGMQNCIATLCGVVVWYCMGRHAH